VLQAAAFGSDRRDHNLPVRLELVGRVLEDAARPPHELQHGGLVSGEGAGDVIHVRDHSCSCCRLCNLQVSRQLVRGCAVHHGDSFHGFNHYFPIGFEKMI
jgi:hypothetical protein